ncbi:hypothetical protein [Solibacillus sp. FSL H8-0538]|uniref:hypothetical protein n=1 Tax=Solibacillus sp. FSL H8-0538 TaxID=2921400 RepID=UPI0030FD00F6
MYKVINRFKENRHAGHIYEPGDIYPTEGKELDESRATFLTQPHHIYGVPFLKIVEDKTSEPPVPKTTRAKKAPATTVEKGDE